MFDEVSPDDTSNSIVNAASVPQLSPFRYPGGKTWLVPRIRRWLAPGGRPRHFIEPFAGGGIISLTVASEQLAEQVTMVELDHDVAVVWQTIVSDDDGEWLAQRILTFDLTLGNVQKLLATTPDSTRERAFQTLVKNRVSHGGVLAPGAGMLKWGEDGKGIRSRWYPATLVRRIRHIGLLRDRIMFLHADGLNIIETQANDPDAVFFIDPPYTAGKNGKRAGRRLYRHNEINHERLFAFASQLRGDFLMTYDDADEVRALAAQHGFETRLVPMKNTHHAKMAELLIGRDLGWLAV